MSHLRIPPIDAGSTPPPGFSLPRTPVSPVTLVQEVAWGEMDSLSHVNNAVYLRWFENVRFWYFEFCGINAYHAETGVGPILAHATIDYLAPVSFPDTVWLATQVVHVRNSSFLMRNRVWSTRWQRDVARGDARCVLVDYRGQGQSVRVPEVLRAAMRALEGTEIEST